MSSSSGCALRALPEDDMIVTKLIAVGSRARRKDAPDHSLRLHIAEQFVRGGEKYTMCKPINKSNVTTLAGGVYCLSGLSVDRALHRPVQCVSHHKHRSSSLFM